jgi:hypothetical protein
MTVTTELGSWHDTASKRAIEEFVARVTRPGSPDFVPAPTRIAVFDNDGTLWAEKPLPVELGFLRRLAGMAERDPALRDRQPWKAAHEKDYAWLGGAVTKHYHGDEHEERLEERVRAAARMTRA